MIKKREAGVLLHISSLPGNEGVGTLGQSSFDFADWLCNNGFNVWQILPVCHAGYAQSPYLALSAFAGNPLFIDLNVASEYYNAKTDIATVNHSDKIDFNKVLKNKMSSLRSIYNVASGSVCNNNNFISFCEAESYWLDEYAVFAAFREKHGNVSIEELPLNFRMRNIETLNEIKISLKDDILFYKFLQYEFFRQWNILKEYVNRKGLKIMGDLPIYVAYDSCDVWQHRELFSVDSELKLTELAGVPPDYFSETGQLWGNPVYKWEKHKEQNYDWWKKRMKKSLEMFDSIRIDHFRGFAEYWTVPAGNKNAVNGKWENGPGMELFNKIITENEKERIIAEDLGVASAGLLKLLDELAFPGMKVLQFAFDESTGNTHKSIYHVKNSVVYTGTHDNDTLAGWLDSLTDDEKERIFKYTGAAKKDLHDEIIRTAMSSVAALCIIPMQDILGLGTKFRMNVPGTVDGNWLWRMRKNYGSNKRCEVVKNMIITYER